jgi:hypothetical protein
MFDFCCYCWLWFRCLDNMIAMTLAPLFLLVLIMLTGVGHYALAGGFSRKKSADEIIVLRERILGRYFILMLFVTYFVLPRCAMNCLCGCIYRSYHRLLTLVLCN